jgi:aspartyl-tRNA(Asn)/glutamyl-tRNA(Gln) amidotransferase subunit A
MAAVNRYLEGWIGSFRICTEESESLFRRFDAHIRRRLRAIRALWANVTAGYDAVLLPTSAILPPDADRLMTDFDYYIGENLLSLRNTRIGNLMDVCALTLPTAEPSCGISFMAGPMQEDRLLRLGIAAERALA